MIRKLNIEQLEQRQVMAGDIEITNGISATSTITQAASTAFTSISSGDWNNPAIWQQGLVPTLNDKVIISAGHSVVVNQLQEFKALDIFGNLTINENVTSYGNVNVMEGGKLDVNNAFIHFIVEDDQIFIGGDSPEGRNDIGLWVEGTANIHGDAKTQSVDLAITSAFQTYLFGVNRAPVTSNSNQVKLTSTPVGWNAGDDVVVISPEGNVVKTKLIGVANGFATLQDNVQVFALQANGQVISPKIINLTKNAGISSDTGNHNAHVMVLHHGSMNATEAEFRNLGPAGKLGRYPIHLHHTHHASTIVNCTIYSTDDASNRGIAIHDTPNNVINNNVIFNVRGHAVFMEDPKGNEVNNVITNNITINVSGDSLGDESVVTPEDATYKKTSHYWVRPGNLISDNIAVGGTALGMVVMPGVGGTSATITNFSAYGVGRYGSQSGIKTTWENPIIINSDVAGYASPQKWGLNDKGTVINNPLFILNGEKPDAPFITETDKAYVSQIFLNQSRELYVIGGFLSGRKGVHVHYSTSVQLVGTKMDVEVLVTPTYFESDVLFVNASIKASYLADMPYPRRMTSHGRIRIQDSTYNGVVTDKTYVSRTIQIDSGVVALSVMKDKYGREAAVEIPNQIATGYVTLPTTVKFVRYWSTGTTKPTYYPIAYMAPSNFDSNNVWNGFGMGLIPGNYTFEMFNASMAVVGTVNVLIEPNKMTFIS